MKKCNFGACMFLCGGIVAAIWVHGGFWRYLHWPSGVLQMQVAACLTIILGCVLAVWLGKSGVFNDLIAAKGSCAAHLRNSLICLSVVSCLLALGVIFRLMHWPGAAHLIIWPAIIISVLLILIGIFGYVIIKK